MKNSEILVNMLDNQERADKLNELFFKMLKDETAYLYNMFKHGIKKEKERQNAIHNYFINIDDANKLVERAKIKNKILEWLDADGGNYSITEKFKEMQAEKMEDMKEHLDDYESVFDAVQDATMR